MTITLPPDLQAQLERLAADRGSTVEAVAQQALEQHLAYEAWFAQQVAEGIASADRGELVSHEDVRALIDRRYPPA